MNQLSDQDHVNMDVFLRQVLDAYKDGDISRVAAVGTLAHVIAALDIGNIDEVRSQFEL